MSRFVVRFSHTSFISTPLPNSERAVARANEHLVVYNIISLLSHCAVFFFHVSDLYSVQAVVVSCVALDETLAVAVLPIFLLPSIFRQLHLTTTSSFRPFSFY
uniref:Uncharacterized protein n=1 Tax=Trypanosoma vivax (strain Y486) TaxID=1055687 RepID=G0U9J4_TRYVY|nr:hypothetical protein TVY486_1117640 [Trypanosoma vivax Y486]